MVATDVVKGGLAAGAGAVDAGGCGCVRPAMGFNGYSCQSGCAVGGGFRGAAGAPGAKWPTAIEATTATGTMAWRRRKMTQL